jgi:hypothetical protein
MGVFNSRRQVRALHVRAFFASAVHGFLRGSRRAGLRRSDNVSNGTLLCAGEGQGAAPRSGSAARASSQGDPRRRAGRHFTVYATDGRLETSNNAAERVIRPSAPGRKSYLFCGANDAWFARRYLRARTRIRRRMIEIGSLSSTGSQPA